MANNKKQPEKPTGPTKAQLGKRVKKLEEENDMLWRVISPLIMTARAHVNIHMGRKTSSATGIDVGIRLDRLAAIAELESPIPEEEWM